MRIRPQTGFETVLSSGISAAATSIGVTTAPTETSGYLVIEPGTANKEIIKYTGVTGTTLTGVSRGLALVGSSDAAGTGKAHPAGVPISMTNVHYYMEQLAQESEANTWADVQTFLATPIFQSSNINIGDGSTDEDEKVTAYNGDANKPFLMYDASENAWVFSDDGTNTTKMVTGGGGLIAGTDIVINASAISLDTTITQDITFTGSVNGIISYPFTAGETITGATLPVPSFLTSSATTITNSATDESGAMALGYDSSRDYHAQSFTTGPNITTITAVTFKLSKQGSPTGNMNVGLYAASGDNPTGVALATKTYDVSTLTGSAADVTITWTTPVAVSPSTKYVIRLDYTPGNTSNYVLGVGSGNGVFTGGVMSLSSDGSSWTPEGSNRDLYFVITQTSLTNGVVYSSDANDPNRLKFYGFAITTANAASSIFVQTSGVVGGFTGLTVGSTYYVSNTVGTISTSAGSTNIPVGFAISTTQIMIDRDINKT